MRPFVVYVGKTRVPWPLPVDLLRKYGILTSHLRTILLVQGKAGLRRADGLLLIAFPQLRPRFIGAFLFYGLAPLLAVLFCINAAPTAVVCQSPFEGFIARWVSYCVPERRRPGIVVEVHGDPRTATRLYGSPVRRVLNPLADRIAASAMRRADRVRVIGSYTRALVREVGYTGEIDEHIAFSDFSIFLDSPPRSLPVTPRVIFIGVLEPYKAPDVLLRAWHIVRHRHKEAVLIIVGEGSNRSRVEQQVEALGLAGSVDLVGRVPRFRIPELIDSSWFLVLPSRSEGLGLVVLEAMCRGRPVVGTSVGGIPELVKSGETGLLVEPEEPDALADAIVSLLSNPRQVEEMGLRARRYAEERNPLAEFDAGTSRLAGWIIEEPWRQRSRQG